MRNQDSNFRCQSLSPSRLRGSCSNLKGLDSSKETFASTLADLTAKGYPAIAFDLRGHGESPLGDEADFSPAALATDVLTAIRDMGAPNGAVLVGHSMGGRVAMRAAALDAESDRPVLRSVVIEDMDIALRGERYVGALDAEEQATFDRFRAADGRRFASWEAARGALLPWYKDEGRVDSWRGKRVRALPDGQWWSDINPHAQRLAAERVLLSDDGARAWDSLAAAAVRCSLHVWYADPPGTVVALDGPGSIDEMRSKLPAAEYRLFAGSGHSIHNDRVHAAAFRDGLCELIDAAAARNSGDTRKAAPPMRAPRGG